MPEKPVITQEMILNLISKLRPIDDILMNRMFQNRTEETAELLRIFLDKPDLKVISSISQFHHESLNSRSVIFDIMARDEDGNSYDIEMQKSTSQSLIVRARYYSASLDQLMLEKGRKARDHDPWKHLKESYVIFVCEDDIFKLGLPLYHVDRYVDTIPPLPFNDGSHIIFVNGAYEDTSTPLGRLIHDLTQNDPDKMFNKVLSDRVKLIKGKQEEITAMCDPIQELIDVINADKDAQIKAQAAEIEAKTDEIKAKDAALVAKDAEIKAKDEEHDNDRRHFLASTIALLKDTSPTISDEEIADKISIFFDADKQSIRNMLN